MVNFRNLLILSKTYWCY